MLEGMVEELMNSLEEDFLDLVKYAPTRSAFHRGAKLLLGDTYRERGEQIIRTLEPAVLPRFLSYFDGPSDG
jgi:hypothetical protein